VAITTVEARAKLKPRAPPYWHKLSSGRHVGYRKMVAGSQGTWLAQAYDDGTRKQTRRSLGAFDALAPSKRFDAASAAAREWFDHLGLGGSTVATTVAKACGEYVRHVRASRPATADDAEARFTRWVYDDKIGEIELTKLTERHVKLWRASLIEQPVVIDPHADKPRTRVRSPASVNRDMTALRAALNHARQDRAVTSDMAWRYALTPVKNANRRREVYLDRAQRKDLTAQAAPDLAAFLRGLSLVPIRPGALALLVAGSFDRRLGVLVVGKDKAGRDRKIKLPPQTAEFFTAHSRGKTPAAPLLARADGKAWTKDGWKKPLRAAAMAAKVGDSVTAYTLRHSVITDLVTGGLDLLTVAQLSGTSVLMIERHYGHYRADLAAAALAGLAL
jgi:integrase